MEKDCNTCKFELYKAEEIPCRDCGMDDREYWQAKPQTNADRIRAMSDEELAEILVEEKEYGVCHIPFFRCPGGKDFDEDRYEDALRYTLEWLKQPAEGD